MFIEDLFPKDHQRYLSLPLLGNALDGFSTFLAKLGYQHSTVRARVRSAVLIDDRLQKQDCHNIAEITRARLYACVLPLDKSSKNCKASAAVKLLERYFDEQKILPPRDREQPNPIEENLIYYCDYLDNVRGLAPHTVQGHLLTASRFLTRFKSRGGLFYLPKLTTQDIEDFIRDTGSRVERETLRHVIAHLRSYLRFLAARGEAPAGLDDQIDTPRIYRDEKLPRALPWETVHLLLQSIDRSTAIGKRDYAMLLCIATYGLRVSEVVGLKLEDIKWRANCLHVFQRKTVTPLMLPLTDAVGNGIIDYIHDGRPSTSYREIFVRHDAPITALTTKAVSGAFRRSILRSGLSIPLQGPHCLRHSYAVHLLRQGVSLKTIGDVLGHRSLESTCVYLRLNIDDLRTVPLNLPILSAPAQEDLS